MHARSLPSLLDCFGVDCNAMTDARCCKYSSNDSILMDEK